MLTVRLLYIVSVNSISCSFTQQEWLLFKQEQKKERIKLLVISVGRNKDVLHK